MSSTALSTPNVAPMVADEWQLAEAFARSGFFTDTRDVAQAIVKIQAGKELGFGPMASMQGVYIVKGKVSLSANLLGAAIKRSGRYDYRVREMSDAGVTIEFLQGSEVIGVSEFTIDDAKRAGLMNSQTWKNYPRNMLFARALSNGARWFCPDVFGGPMYTPEELGAAVDEEGVPIDLDTRPVYTSPPATPAPVERHAKPARPFDAETTRNAIQARASQLAATLTGPASTPEQWQIGGMVSRAVWGDADADDFRHATLLAVFGVRSLKDVTEAQAAAWIRWAESGEHVRAESEMLVDTVPGQPARIDLDTLADALADVVEAEFEVTETAGVEA